MAILYYYNITWHTFNRQYDINIISETNPKFRSYYLSFHSVEGCLMQLILLVISALSVPILYHSLSPEIKSKKLKRHDPV